MNLRRTTQKLGTSTLLGYGLLVSAALQAQDIPAADLASSQELTLFEEVESTAAGNSSPTRPSRESRVTSAEPEFTLVGTSRIGNDYTAMIKHKSGEVLIVKAKPGENSVIQEYSDYMVVDVNAGSVSVRYPSNNPCVDFTDLGVRCRAAGNIANLVLSNGDPLQSTNPAMAAGDGSVSIVEETEDSNAEPTNPFEALRNAQNNRVTGAGDENPARGRFTPRRIDPADVPEGMRVIATPFGDRLVEQ